MGDLRGGAKHPQAVEGSSRWQYGLDQGGIHSLHPLDAAHESVHDAWLRVPSCGMDGEHLFCPWVGNLHDIRGNSPRGDWQRWLAVYSFAEI